MCGIVSYLGDKEAYPILIEGLQRLEYRGYDSAGVALLINLYRFLKRKVKFLIYKLLLQIKTLRLHWELDILGGLPTVNQTM